MSGLSSVSALPRPIGVFDSGVGGLSVLRALRAALPLEHFVYLADSAYAPYGERGDAFVTTRTQAVAQHLVDRYDVKALVIACNTATAAAIEKVRSLYPQMPVIGVEPAVKTAASITKTGHVGVIGTRGTLTSTRFSLLLATVEQHAQFVVQPCDGLAHAIEQSMALGENATDVNNALRTPPGPIVHGEPALTATAALCERYLGRMGRFGNAPGDIDTLVLGCTHYVFVADELRKLVGPHVTIIETGEPVARQTHRLLTQQGWLNTGANDVEGTSLTNRPVAGPTGAHTTGTPISAVKNAVPGAATVQLLTTGSLDALQAAAVRWLNLPAACCDCVGVP